MTDPMRRAITVAGAAATLMLATTAVAFPAKTPPNPQDQRLSRRPVILVNQSAVIAQGLTPTDALRRAGKIVKYRLTTAHYIPGGFQLVIVRAFPLIPGSSEPQDTQTFYNLPRATRATRPSSHTRVVIQPPSFDIDHQYAQPYVYDGAYFTIKTARLSNRRTVTTAEQHYRTQRGAVDLLYVYWYDRTSRLATEVTADLQSSRLTRDQLLRVAGSIS